jgi:hypothetical protein
MDLTQILKLLQNTINTYHSKSKFWSGVNEFWVVSNSNKVAQNIAKINERKAAHSVSTFDFSTLYTKIPHDLLFEAMDKIVDLVFKRKTNHFIHVSRTASWSTSGTAANGNRVYSKEKIKLAIRYLVENCFFKVGGLLFRQTIGIPMGSDPAPFLANLFLYVYESEWLQDLKKTDPIRARRFVNVFRYIDDLISINDRDEFLNSYLSIYPPQMKLTKENSSHKEATFLDMGIEINNGTISTKLYDKRDAFGFSIVRMPYASSNVPSKMFYATICAEILRIGRASSLYSQFLRSTQAFLARMKKQGAKINGVRKTSMKMLNRHFDVFSKYQKSLQGISDDIMSYSS